MFIPIMGYLVHLVQSFLLGIRTISSHTCFWCVLAQVRVALLHDDPGSLLHGFGVSAAQVGGSLVKEETA